MAVSPEVQTPKLHWIWPLAGALILLWLWLQPHWQTSGLDLKPAERMVLETQIRDTWAKIIWAVVTLGAASVVWRYLQEMSRAVAQNAQIVADAQRNAFFAAEAQTTERYARAMALLGDDKMEVRLGGIYALERIARESKTDHGPIMEVLAAYVREHAAWQEGEPAPPRLRADLQAILTVLGRRTTAYDAPESHIDLHGTSLARAYLPWANLERAFLYEANFDGALLQNANLKGAWLWKSDLQGAVLDGAHLEGADLTGVANLAPEQLRGAIVDSSTKLPNHLRDSQEEKPNLAPSEAGPEDLKLPSVRAGFN